MGKKLRVGSLHQPEKKAHLIYFTIIYSSTMWESDIIWHTLKSPDYFTAKTDLNNNSNMMEKQKTDKNWQGGH